MATRNSNGENLKDSRVRNYATVVYPESAPENWQEILSGHFVPCFVSPLHDKDENPGGESKKPHYHVILMFDGKKTVEQAKEIFDSIGGVGCEVVKSIRGYSRYLCHLDNPEKAQYEPSEMQDFCDKYNVVSFFLLSNYARSHRPDWHRILCDSSAIFMREYLKSKKWSVEVGQLAIVDPETGEILD